MEEKRVNVLGTEYKIVISSEKETPEYYDDRDGECDETLKELRVNNYEAHKGEPHFIGDITVTMKKNIRHELIHAFLCESGLAENSSWAQNEEMVDWIARQFVKMQKAFQEVDAI